MIERSYLYQEIHEQPAVLAEVLRQEQAVVERLAAEVRRRGVEHVVIAARGTSDNAARYAQYLLGAVNGLTVALAAPSLFTIYQRPPRLGNALVLGVSQSGKSPDIVSVVAEGRRQGALTAAITNFADSDLGRAAEVVVGLHAGQERSIAATKTYTSELMAIGLLSVALAGDAEMLATLRGVPDAVARTLALWPEVLRFAERYRYMRACVAIGRGYNYATAFELALKLKELTYTMVEPYSSADFLHGPLALIEEAFPAVVIAPGGAMLPEMRQFVGTLKERGAETIIVSDDEAILSQARVPVRLPVSLPEWASPLTAIVPGQLFAMALAHVRDYDVDRPRGLRKVTETR
ncbi:MAG TPA: SIS domain-containing protein [Roseiflexaceae bacterium]|nr:SIS domain-containing protein [Roseiflexaceae bacterium]